ncbi:hypothetical protein BIV57_12330 [Mangrovactinospora gilvigrisea]|uniref:M50 family peptidase n=1 Tax=Mangrovactinospora gilvigrisea TaxID=1428644 RepID=A0A1J7BF63_9ACTN|nr:M50 family metallopeptidase [Mangrovactinospora gilvigrisea]OIV37213.1 hypothetical protein BIV57_12330 [Mangrovactinospora gilvigrisea]
MSETTTGAHLSQVWHDVLGTQPAPALWLVWATAAAALLLVVSRPSWRIGRNLVTIAHEGGHGLAAVLTGRRLTSIRLHSDTSGLTVSRGRPHGPGMVLTAAAGYTAPPIVGLAGAWLLSADHITALLWLAIVLLFLMLLMIRNAYGVVAVLVTGGLIFAVSWFASASVQAGFAYVVVWFLVLSGVRPVIELQAKRSRGEAPESDADQLGRLTPFPAGLWIFLFFAVSLACLAVAASRLLSVTP